MAEEKSISKIKIGRVDYNLVDVKAARTDHKHSANAITDGVLPVSHGGTGLSESPSMLVNLGATTADDVLKTSPRPGITGTLGIDNGGTGAITAAGAVENIVDGQDIEPNSVNAQSVMTSNGILTYGSVTAGNDVIVGLTFGEPEHYLTQKANSAAVAKVESSTATTTTPEGGLFMLDGNLRKAMSDIAIGDTINNSNSVTTEVTKELTDIKNATISTKGGIISDGPLVISDHNLAIKNTNIDRDTTNPSSIINGNGQFIFLDNDNESTSFIDVVRETDGRIGLRLVAVNEKTDGSQIYNGLKLYIKRDGTISYEVANPEAFRNAIGAAQQKNWTLLGSVYGEPGSTISYNLSNYSEAMFVAYYGNIYCGSAIIPTTILSTSTQREIYLGGGSNGNNVGRNFAIKATLTQGVIASATVDNAATIAQWEVYGK